MRLQLARFTLTSLLVAAVSSAQPISETVEVRVVEIDVSVLDRSGKPVGGLTYSSPRRNAI